MSSSSCGIAEVDLWILTESTHSEATEELRKHVDGCPECQARLAEMKRLTSGLESIGRTPPALPDKIGPYRILRLLGEGGMGFVYEAEQSDPKRSVAVKVLRPQTAIDERVLRAFRREVRALARLDHPDIATIYNAGSTEDGQVYLAMRLVDGKPLDQYCDEQNLDLRARVSLMARIARAVHYAHQRGILHQDLKPANILVDSDGNPHVLDFGLARPVQTDEGESPSLSVSMSGHSVVGTLAFMSPEQARGDDDIDVRTDVYALGVILYRLLTEHAPYRVSSRLEQAVRSITEAVPSHPSTKEKAIPRELGDVVMKAMAKERERRYDSAIGLAVDLEHYLAGEAVAARPTSFGYQLRVFARRHKAAVASAAAVFLALLAGILGIGLALARAERERAEAELVTTLIEEAMGVVDPFETLGQVPTALDSMNKVAERLETEELFAPDSLHEARLRSKIGVAYHNMGEAAPAGESAEPYAMAEPHLRNAFETRRRALGETHPKTLQSAHDLGLNIRRQGGRLEEAHQVFIDAIAAWRTSNTGNTLAVAAMLRELGTRQMGVLNNYEEAGDLFRQAERMAATFPPSNYRNVVWSWTWHQMGLIANRRRDHREGIRVSRRALEIRRELGPYHPHLYYSFAGGGLMGRLIDVADAEHQAEGLALFKEFVTYSEHPMGSPIIGRRFNLARQLWRLEGDPTALPPLFEELVDDSVEASIRLRAQLITREASRAAGQLEDAAYWDTRLSHSVDEAFQQNPRDPHLRWDLARDIFDLAALWLPAGRSSELPSAVTVARPLVQKALELLSESGERIGRLRLWILSLCGDDMLTEDAANTVLDAFRFQSEDDYNSERLTIAGEIAEFRREAGSLAAAEGLARNVLERSEKGHGPRSGHTAVAMRTLGRILDNLGDHDEAERLFRGALEILQETAGEDHLEYGLAQRDLGTLLQRQGRYPEAEEQLRDALRILSVVRGHYHWETARTRSELGACLIELERGDEGAAELGIAYRSFKHVLGDEHKWTKLAAERLASIQR